MDDYDNLSDMEIQELIATFVLSIPGNLCRSVFYHYVVRLEQPIDIAERLNITEDEVIDYILEAQESAKQNARDQGFNIVERPVEEEDNDDDFTYDLEFLLGEINDEDDDDDEFTL